MLLPDLMKVLGGALKKERFYVPRENLDIDSFAVANGKEHVVQVIFPSWDHWVLQHKNCGGDQSRAAKNSLFGWWPFFARVVVQNGIHWIDEYV